MFSTIVLHVPSTSSVITGSSIILDFDKTLVNLDSLWTFEIEIHIIGDNHQDYPRILFLLPHFLLLGMKAWWSIVELAVMLMAHTNNVRCQNSLYVETYLGYISIIPSSSHLFIWKYLEYFGEEFLETLFHPLLQIDRCSAPQAEPRLCSDTTVIFQNRKSSNIEHKIGNCSEYQYIKTWDNHRVENKYNVLRERSLKPGKQASHEPIHKNTKFC